MESKNIPFLNFIPVSPDLTYKINTYYQKAYQNRNITVKLLKLHEDVFSTHIS